MARAGTSEFRHPLEHIEPSKHNAFWSDGIAHSSFAHPFHAWKINRVPVPSYHGLNTTSNDFYTKTWALKATNRGEETIGWAGKCATHSPRFHGTQKCKMKFPSAAELRGWATDVPPRTPLSTARSSARSARSARSRSTPSLH